jgi:hypothetical protein
LAFVLDGLRTTAGILRFAQDDKYPIRFALSKAPAPQRRAVAFPFHF